MRSCRWERRLRTADRNFTTYSRCIQTWMDAQRPDDCGPLATRGAPADVDRDHTRSPCEGHCACRGFQMAVLRAKYLFVNGGFLRLAYQIRKRPSGNLMTDWLVT